MGEKASTATRASSQHKGHAFDHIGDPEEDLSEIRLDMKEGGQQESLRMQLIAAEQRRKGK